MNAATQTVIPPADRLKESGVAFSLAALLPLVVSVLLSVVVAIAGEGATASVWYRYLAYLLPQLCFAAAAAVYIRRTRHPFAELYQSAKPRYFVLAVLLQFGLLFSLGELNTLFISFLEKLGYTSSASVLPPLEGGWLALTLLVVALLPAVFEETLFRGILARNMQGAGWGTAVTILVSGALFSLFHGRPEQTIYQFLCGCCFALIAVRAGSILPTVLSHLINNAAILILTATGYQTEGGWTMPQGWHIGLIAAACAALAAVLLFLLLDKSNAQKGGVRDGKQFFLGAGVGILVCAVLWISNLVTGLTGV